MAQQTQINGNRYSFVDVSVTMNGVDQPKGIFKSINYKASKKRGVIQGNQVTPVGRTRGYAESSGSVEMLRSEYDDFVKDITNDGEIPILDAEFDVEVSYSTNDVDTITDSLRGVCMEDLDLNNQQGTDGAYVVVQLSIMRIKLNGIDAYSDEALTG
jgi:hypothetical protein